jgi:hypothetical protein
LFIHADRVEYIYINIYIRFCIWMLVKVAMPGKGEYRNHGMQNKFTMNCYMTWKYYMYVYRTIDISFLSPPFRGKQYVKLKYQRSFTFEMNIGRTSMMR